MASKLEVEVEVKSNAEKIWESIKDSATVLPKALPDKYESIEEKLGLVDEANKTLSHSVVDGAMLKFYNYFKATPTVTPKGNGSLVKWSCEFDKASDEVPNSDFIKDFAVKNFQDLDAYLLGVP
ncbi:hypothetical protein BUALT_Bualt17G0050400 [Buddleja alternifolia]|uniref:Bet v I/Major latex protein domain-containing protein n=1 Tax=Buddleja alternifolia TaxID=168488 RepID=A0AAV6W6V7_9LAMI|nr:hypothetical protein BUALT_Bualt17G0050400 [Buddleja alternifolia]